MGTDPRIGTELAGYRIESLLGRGGMSVVYLAVDTRLGRRVALKLLAPELSQDEGFRERFVRESRLAESLDHPNIVPIFEAGEADGALFIAMRHVRGTDLRTLIQRDGPLTLPQASRVITQVAAALDEAHDQGLIHRDVKTANVLVSGGTGTGDAGGHVYLSDFGLTKQALAGSGMTGTGQFMGSIDYAAPEQFQGKPVDARTDVYALGCVLFECLTGGPPFRRDSEAAVLYAHLSEPPPSVAAVRDGVPLEVDDVVSKAMAKDPGARYERCGQLASALQAAAAHAVVADDTKMEGSPGTVQLRRATSRTRALWLAGGGLAVAAVVVLAVVLSVRGGGGGAPSPSPSASRGASGPTPLMLGHSVVRVDPATGKAGRPIGLPGGNGFVTSVAVGENAVWATSGGGLSHVDPAMRLIVNTIPNPPALVPVSVMIAEHDLWAGFTTNVVNQVRSEVIRIDPATDEIIERIPIARPPPFPGPVPLAFARGSIWAAGGNPEVERIDPSTDHVVDTIALPGTPTDLVAGYGSVWAIFSDLDELVRIDARTGRTLASIALQGGATALATGPDSLWVINNIQGIARKVDPSTNTVADQLSVGGTLTAIAVGDDGILWVTRSNGELARVDPVTRKVTVIPFVGRLDAVVVAPDGVWVISRALL